MSISNARITICGKFTVCDQINQYEYIFYYTEDDSEVLYKYTTRAGEREEDEQTVSQIPDSTRSVLKLILRDNINKASEKLNLQEEREVTEEEIENTKKEIAQFGMNLQCLDELFKKYKS